MDLKILLWRVSFGVLAFLLAGLAGFEYFREFSDSANEPSAEVVAYARVFSAFWATASLCLALLAAAPVRFRLLALPGVIWAIGMAVVYANERISVKALDGLWLPLPSALFLVIAALLLVFLATVRSGN